MQPLRLPEGVPEGTEVFQLTLDLRAPLSDADWALLSEDEGARASRYRQHADKVRFVRTRGALRCLLAERLRARPMGLTFFVDQRGKPRLHGPCSAGPAMHFNVSHAGRHALIALSRHGVVGVDIERRNPGLDVAELESQMLSQREKHSGPEERPGFFDCWSAKEAALKALGLGVAEHLRQLSVLLPKVPMSAEGRRDCRYRLHCEGAEWPPLSVCRLPAPDGYAAALAWVDVSDKESP